MFYNVIVINVWTDHFELHLVYLNCIAFCRNGVLHLEIANIMKQKFSCVGTETTFSNWKNQQQTNLASDISIKAVDYLYIYMNMLITLWVTNNIFKKRLHLLQVVIVQNYHPYVLWNIYITFAYNERSLSFLCKNVNMQHYHFIKRNKLYSEKILVLIAYELLSLH